LAAPKSGGGRMTAPNVHTSLATIRVDHAEAWLREEHLDDRATESVAISHLGGPNQDATLFTEEVRLEARDVQALRDWHAERVDALDRELGRSPPEKLTANNASHASITAGVVERIYRALDFGLPLSAGQVHEIRRMAVQSPTVARALRDWLDQDLERFTGPNVDPPADDSELHVVAALNELVGAAHVDADEVAR